MGVNDGPQGANGRQQRLAARLSFYERDHVELQHHHLVPAHHLHVHLVAGVVLSSAL